MTTEPMIRSFTPFQLVLITRLHRLQSVKAELDGLQDPDPFMQKLVGRGIFSTYRDCVDEGIGHEAREILGLAS